VVENSVLPTNSQPAQFNSISHRLQPARFYAKPPPL
jgi:hypothetical protein